MKQAVTVVGSVALDDIETDVSQKTDVVGGSAIYFSISGSFFSKIEMVGVAGTDFPKKTIEELKKYDIDLEGLKLQEGKTFKWGGRYHSGLQKRDTLYTHLNVFKNFSPNIPDNYKNTPYVFLGNIQPELQLSVLNQLESPEFVALDTMNLWINEKREKLMKVIKRSDLLIINDEELTDLTEERNIIKGVRSLHQEGIKYIIIKKGQHGAYLSHFSTSDQKDSSLFYSPAFPTPLPKDPTGAGDSFAGGFMGYLASCDEINFTNMKKALVYGNIMGSFSIEEFSIKKLLQIDKKDIEERYKKLRKISTI